MGVFHDYFTITCDGKDCQVFRQFNTKKDGLSDLLFRVAWLIDEEDWFVLHRNGQGFIYCPKHARKRGE